MEFIYRISEAEYLSAAKLKFKSGFRLGNIKTAVLLWVVIAVCLILFFAFFQHGQPQPTISDDAAIRAVASNQTINMILTNLLPVVLVLGFLAYVIFRSVPMQLRRVYKKDPSMQAQFMVNITSESISIQSTAGTSSTAGWNIYDYWREGKCMILMVLKSGVAFPISLANLSDDQRDELRGILAAALPKK